MKKRLLVSMILALGLLLFGTATALAGFTCYHCWSTNTEVLNISQSGGSGTGSNWQQYHCYLCICNACHNIIWVDQLHNSDGIDPAKASTCTEPGWNQSAKCTICGKVHNRSYISPTGHTEVIDRAVAPTCTEPGLTEGKHCSVCTQTLTAQSVVAATGHTEVVDAAVAPACTETGLTEGKHCSVCTQVISPQELIPATGHTEVMDQAVPPTCTATGLTVGCHCSVCGMVIDAPQVVEAAGHTIAIDNAVAPTCTEAGLTDGSHCSVCGAVIAKRRIAPALGHDYSAFETVSPTCLKGGYSHMRCARCGVETKANLKDRLSHWYGPWSPAGDRTHTAECLRGCGHAASAPCESGTIGMAGLTLSACPVCGAVSGEGASLPEGFALAAVDGAGAEKASGNGLPAGELAARSADGPMGEDGKILRLYTLAYEFAGTGTPAGPMRVSLPLNGELPAFRLVCVGGPDAGKAIPFEVRDGVLVFTANLPGAYTLVAE